MNPSQIEKIEEQVSSAARDVIEAKRSLQRAQERMEAACMKLEWISRKVDVLRYEVS